MDQIKLLQQLIDKSEDPKEIEDLKAQQLELIKQHEREAAQKEAKEQAQKEFEEEKSRIESEKEEAESKLKELKDSMKAGQYRDSEGSVKVGEPDKYRGFNLNRAKAAFKEQLSQKERTKTLERVNNNPESFNHLVKTFTDMVADSYEGPVSKDQISGTDTSGGYLVNDDDRDELLAYARDSSVSLRRADIVRMNSDVVTMPREDAKVTLAFSDESTSMTETSATFEQIKLTAEDLDGFADVSIHLEQDNTTPGGIVGVLLDQFVEAYGQKIDNRVFTGGSTSSVFELAGNTVTLGSTNFASIDVGDLRSAIGKLKPNRRNGAAWFGEYSVIWDYLFGVKENSQSVLIPDYRNAARMMALGYPVEEVVEAPNTDSSDSDMLLFGNLNGFKVGERLNTLTLFRDPYTQRTNKRIRYSFLTRVAFSMALPNNFVRIKTSA